jgi:hypothetical protein
MDVTTRSANPFGRITLLMRRPSIAVLYYSLLLLAMAAGQIADTGGFANILRTFELFGDAESQLAVLISIVELVTGAAILLAGATPGSRMRVVAPLGLLVAVFWTVVAAQAYARGLDVPNCGCFGVYLGQSLRWWVLLEDAGMLVLAWLAVRATGVRLRGRPWPGLTDRLRGAIR